MSQSRSTGDANPGGPIATPALSVSFHGAARTVTGSCYELRAKKGRLLVDCGLFQGPRSLEGLNRGPWPFPPDAIDAVLLTHAHIDHSGMIPRLVRDGFRGPIFCTQPTIELLQEMLRDSGRIHEADTERRNRRPDRRDEEPLEPLYTEADAILSCEQLKPVEFGQWFEPCTGVRARYWNAGHILGSASIEIEADGTRLLFSGDLGPDNKAFHPDPSAPVGIDHLFCESTYGDREREDLGIAARRARLGEEITEALARGGNLVVPVFALERTQELLLDIAHLINTSAITRAHVFIDSPLAQRLTRVFVRHATELEDIGGTEVFRHPAFHFVETPQQSIGLNSMSGAIILAASGMCEAGRVRHHLVENLPRSDSTILFVGFQAAGTLGRKLKEGARRVRISGRDVGVRATVKELDGYSAHADRRELLDWIAARAPVTGTTFLTHGEKSALISLKEALKDRHTVLPEIGEVYELFAGAPARRLKTARLDVQAILTDDWQNDYADFTLQLKRRLRDLQGEQDRREAIARMRAALSDYERMRLRVA